jgi:hypothetical protein
VSTDEHHGTRGADRGSGNRGGPGPAATFATTEHFNLQTARALTVSEANGRASIQQPDRAGLVPSRCTNATAVARATPTAQRPSIGAAIFVPLSQRSWDSSL